MIVVVPTYDYLSRPILELLLELKRPGSELVRVDFPQPRADFGRLPDLPGVQRTVRFGSDGKAGFVSLVRLKRQLLDFLAKADPSVIVTFSDATVFARFVKGTRFEERMLVVQPCLLSPHPPSLGRRARYAVGAILNKSIGRGVFRTKHFWGEVLPRATYAVWSDVEAGSGHVIGRTLRCGRFFQTALDTAAAAPSYRPTDILVLVPDLPYYTSDQLAELTRGFTLLLERHADRRFAFKYHPRNRERLPLGGHANYQELEQFDPADVARYDIVISGFSNMAVTLRAHHSRIIVFDLGWYADDSNPYLQPEYFRMPRDARGLADDFEAMLAAPGDGSGDDAFARLFETTDECVHELERYLDPERVRSHLGRIAGSRPGRRS